MKKTLLDITERAASSFLFSYAAASSVLAGGFGTHNDLKIAGGAAVLSVVKNVSAYLAAQGNGPDAVGFNDGGADVPNVDPVQLEVPVDAPSDPGVIPA